MVGRLVSFLDGFLPVATLVSGRVTIQFCQAFCTTGVSTNLSIEFPGTWRKNVFCSLFMLGITYLLLSQPHFPDTRFHLEYVCILYILYRLYDQV